MKMIIYRSTLIEILKESMIPFIKDSKKGFQLRNNFQNLMNSMDLPII